MSAPAVVPGPAGPAAVPSRNAPGKGIAFMLLAVGLFAIMDALVKWLGATYPTVELVFFRSAFAFVPIGFLIARGGGLRRALLIRNPWGHVIRCLMGVGSLALMFYCFPRMPLADMIAITFAAPIFITALSVPLLRETVGPRRWAAVIVGFVGVLIIVRPGAGTFDLVVVAALLGTLLYALVAIAVRWLSRTESSVSIVFAFTLTCTLASAAFLPFQWVTPDLVDWLLLISVGLIGGCAQIAITEAFRMADVSLVVPFEYTAILWATGLGYAFWGEIPGSHVWLGVAIVMASGLYILYRETTLGLPRGTARKLQAKR